MTQQTQPAQQVPVTAVLVSADVFAGLQKYLFDRPYAEVAQLIQAMGQAAALSAEQVEFLQTFNPEGTEEEEAPDEKKDKKDKKSDK